MLKSVRIPTVIVISFMMMNTVAALQYGSYTFSPLEFAALTTSLLVLYYPRKQTQTMKELCDSLGPKGYIWDVSLEICYHLNTIEPNAVDAKRKCMSEHPNSIDRLGPTILQFQLSIDYYKYKRVGELNDKEALDPEVFLYRTLSAIQCISQCALIPNCESVFYFQSSCKGYSAVYSPSSSNLGSKYGARYYIDKQAKAGTTESNTEDTTTSFEFDQTTSISTQFATTRNAMLDNAQLYHQEQRYSA